VLESGSRSKAPPISRQPPSTLPPLAPWGFGNGPHPMPSSVFGSFYDDSSEEIGGLSPGFRPGSSQEDIGIPGEARRPSVASATTVSSRGSKSSVGRGFHKKLQGFFGDEFPESSRQNSDSSLPASAMFAPGVFTPGATGDQAAMQRARNRNNSVQINNTGISRPTSPTSFSRPRSPPTSEVAPWEFQDHLAKVSVSWTSLEEKARPAFALPHDFRQLTINYRSCPRHQPTQML